MSPGPPKPKNNGNGNGSARRASFRKSGIVNPTAARTLNSQPSTSNRLSCITDWPQLAHDARYSVRALAKACGVSVRTFERFISPAFGDPPHRWLKRLRMQRAVELLRDRSTVRETAFCLGYEDPSHFSREFKKCRGYPPHKSPHPLRNRQQAAECRDPP